MTESYKLPSNELIFELSETGEETKQAWNGRFVYKRPNIGKRLLVATTATRLLGEADKLSIEITNLAGILAKLQHCLIEYPEWWKNSNFGKDLYDLNIILSIFNKCQEFDEEYEKKVFGDNIEDIKVKTKK